MEVKAGYKMTEVGEIPEDWEATTVGGLVKEGVIENPLDGNHGELHPKSNDFVSYGIPFIMANNIHNGNIDFERCAYIRKEQADSLRKGFSIHGDVLLTHKATIGNTAIVGEIIFDYLMLTPQVTYYRVADPSRLSNIYLRHFFDYPKFQSVLKMLSGGGTRSYIGITAQLQLPVVIPPTKAEQEAIAAALSDADALIESLEQLIAKKRNIKQGAMQELLTGKRRLSGFTGEWEVKRLGDIAEPRKERIDPRRSITQGCCIELEHIEQGTGVLLGCTTTSNLSSLKSIFREGDVLFGKLRAYLRKYWIAPYDGFCSTEIWPLVANRSKIIPQYLFQIVTLDSFIESASYSYGTHMPRSDWNVLKNFEIAIPKIEEQSVISAMLSDMDAEIQALMATLSKARQLKQGMMQELLTGRIRLA